MLTALKRVAKEREAAGDPIDLPLLRVLKVKRTAQAERCLTLRRRRLLASHLSRAGWSRRRAGDGGDRERNAQGVLLRRGVGREPSTGIGEAYMGGSLEAGALWGRSLSLSLSLAPRACPGRRRLKPLCCLPLLRAPAPIRPPPRPVSVPARRPAGRQAWTSVQVASTPTSSLLSPCPRRRGPLRPRRPLRPTHAGWQKRWRRRQAPTGRRKRARPRNFRFANKKATHE